MVITMQFVLPSKYTNAEATPKPIDERVIIKEEGERKYGVVRFSGVATDVKWLEETVEKLKKSLEKDGHMVIGEFLLVRYNPPWNLPLFRANEIMIPIQ
ncbi:SOUL heme-binding protein [Macleaya cordata]|uniref:SOUL heme-binding protein n=1 Tax=Macleaya cordata TaxID=56857 RepID=A0A200Q819_MACCD|nr:SOUL heme-binding protein [Macleaya cordata]OVA15539.1 SOUL heme-binding protein [Macleaya cordata]